MSMATDEMSYFKVGFFVLVGLALIVFALLIFGSSRLFQPVAYIETYFEESVQGISEGTPVKYRGLQIGYVKDVAFTSEIYKGVDGSAAIQLHSIYAKIAITSKLFTQLSSADFKKTLQKEVANGLRVRLVTQGLTGTSYLELDYFDPKSLKPLQALNWAPNFFYVPSQTSTLTRLSENAQHIMDELKDVNFKKLFGDLGRLINVLEGLSSSAENIMGNASASMVMGAQNFKAVTDDLHIISTRLKMKPSEVVFGSYPKPLDPGKI